MRFFIKGYLVSMLAGVISLIANQALAVTAPGATMKNSFPQDNSCLSTSSYGGIINNCSYSVQVVGTLQLSPGSHPTSVRIYGNNSSCQAVSINGVGNGFSFSSLVYTTSGPKDWQTLNLGSLDVNDGPDGNSETGTLFRCSLEAGGIIGNFTAK
ncbi:MULTISPECIES: hypothetical protein [unclassified Nostoc]|uniref:hypothetical protein n=1 Tax=unclassified Nostoc TaxID=2593658 RepID=UPI0025AA9AA3|nr:MULTISPECIES: hypothetical protein [unclassified Nostoc]MDM9583803.1 hypothetical protein [Nostoc sp. GT001]MDZ7946940.1 hypothetical protein [Nostoc sp. EfeVER01]MDZ7993328.1 hypothetical protein [Nostoc sp. EspVER01]